MRKQDGTIEALRRLPDLGACSDEDLEALASLGDEVDIAEGEILTRQRAFAMQAFFVLEGRAIVSIDDRPVATIAAGEFVGEWALERQQPRSATVTAETAMRVLAFNPRSFYSLSLSPGLRKQIQAALARNARDQAMPDPVPR